MRPCGSHRPPLRFSNLASSASSSFIFRFLRDGDVGVCSPSRRVFLIAVPLVMEKGPFYVAQGPQEGGRGGVLNFVLFLRGFLPFRAFVLRMWVYARASCSCSSSSHKSSWAHPRRGTWPDFVFVFVVVFMSRTKIGPPRKSKNLHL